MKINIVGWYGKNNVGDEAFRFVFENLFRGHELRFVTPPGQCEDADITILGGGAVASPYYLDVLPPGRRYALGIDLAYESEADLLAKANFSGIAVRTQTDANILAKKVSCPVFHVPDLAFHINPTGSDILGRYKQTDKRTLGVLVTDYVNPAIDRPPHLFGERAWSFITNLAVELDLLSEKFEILLIPCSTGGYGDDRRINLDLAAFMKKPPTNIFETIGPQDMVDLIAQCDATLCQRFHAHIFSIIAGTPFVSIEFTRKVKLLLEENDLQAAIAGYKKENGFDFHNISTAVAMATLSPGFIEAQHLGLLNIANANYAKLENFRQQVLQGWIEGLT